MILTPTHKIRQVFFKVEVIITYLRTNIENLKENIYKLLTLSFLYHHNTKYKKSEFMYKLTRCLTFK